MSKMSLYRLLYTLLFATLPPLAVARLLLRSRKNPAYRQRIAERFGYLPHTRQPVRVWLHAVSVGETIAARPLIEALLRHFGDHNILVSSTTVTGSDTVKRLFNGRVQHIYLPYDVPSVLRRTFARLRPEILIIMETEIWPNLWAAAQKNGIPVVLANARLSDKAASRYSRFKPLVAETLRRASLIGCRNARDRDKFLSLGAPEVIVKIMGDIKLEQHVPDAMRELGGNWRRQWGAQRPVLMAASTHEGEDEQILQIYGELRRQLDDLLLVIAPRHPERFDSVHDRIIQHGYRAQRRSNREAFKPRTQVILGDTMGEMFAWFCAADVVFMGGSLVDTGGHNPLEPAACGAPVVSGPAIFNFTAVYELLEQRGVAVVAANLRNVSDEIGYLLLHPQKRQSMRSKGLELIEEHSGIVNRWTTEIINRVEGS